MTQQFSDRFRSDSYAEDEPVAISANGQAHSVPERLFTRLQQIAGAYELHLLPSIDIYTRTVLDGERCEAFVDEVAFVAEVVNDPLLRPHVDQLIALGKSCLSRGNAELTIDGP